MLVLTRKPDQSIVIGENIIVRVLRVDRGRVKLGISAPIEVHVDRAEIAERKAAAGESGDDR